MISGTPKIVKPEKPIDSEVMSPNLGSHLCFIKSSLYLLLTLIMSCLDRNLPRIKFQVCLVEPETNALAVKKLSIQLRR